MRKIVLAHGWGATAERLEPLKLDLTKRGWQVVNLDLPGFGVKAPETAWGLDDYADWVEKQIDGKYVFFGHSFGGRVAIKLAARKASGLEGIVLCAAGGLDRENKTKLTVFKKIAKWGKAMLGEADWARAWLYRAARVHDYERATGIMKEVFKKVVNEDVIGQLELVKLPTLILWGSEDRMVKVAGGKMAQEKIEGSELAVCDGEGHRLPYNQPEWVAERIEQWYKAWK